MATMKAYYGFEMREDDLLSTGYQEDIAWNDKREDPEPTETIHTFQFGYYQELIFQIDGLSIDGQLVAAFLNGEPGARKILYDAMLSGDDLIEGSASVNKLLGGAGNDTIYGNDGYDDLYGEDGDDVISGGLDFDYLFGGDGDDTLKGGDDTDHLHGEPGHDTLLGGDGSDSLWGGQGNDTLNGGAGPDTLRGELGNDTYLIGPGDDVIENAGEGTDTVSSDASCTLRANFENLVLDGDADIGGTGNSENNRIIGNTGNNSLLGSSGNDRLEGMSGGDLLNGGSGNDTLLGGAGVDRFRFNATLNSSNNVDAVRDFTTSSGDVLQLENAIFTKLTQLGVLSAANFRASASGTAADANDFILYNTDDGALYYDADGNGSGARVKFAQIGETLHPALTAADFGVI